MAICSHTRAFATHAKAAAAALVELGCFCSDHCSYAKRDRLVRGHCRGGALTGHWQAGIGVSDHERLGTTQCPMLVLVRCCSSFASSTGADWRRDAWHRDVQGKVRGEFNVLVHGSFQTPPPPLTHTTPNTHVHVHVPPPLTRTGVSCNQRNVRRIRENIQAFECGVTCGRLRWGGGGIRVFTQQRSINIQMKTGKLTNSLTLSL